MKLFRGISRWQFTTTRYVTWKSTTNGVTDAKEEENVRCLCWLQRISEDLTERMKGICYQLANGCREAIQCAFRLIDKKVFGFR